MSFHGMTTGADPFVARRFRCAGVHALEHLYRTHDSFRPVTAEASQPGILKNLALFHVPWTALPGVVQVIQVSGPEWVHMFEEIHENTQDGTPARFGHLARPNSVSSIALPHSAFLPGSV